GIDGKNGEPADRLVRPPRLARTHEKKRLDDEESRCETEPDEPRTGRGREKPDEMPPPMPERYSESVSEHHEPPYREGRGDSGYTRRRFWFANCCAVSRSERNTRPLGFGSVGENHQSSKRCQTMHAGRIESKNPRIQPPSAAEGPPIIRQ